MTINEKINLYGQLGIKAEKIENQRKALRQEIITEMLSTGVNEILTGAHKAIYKLTTKTSIDTTALKKALPEVAETFTKTTQTEYFRVF